MRNCAFNWSDRQFSSRIRIYTKERISGLMNYLLLFAFFVVRLSANDNTIMMAEYNYYDNEQGSADLDDNGTASASPPFPIEGDEPDDLAPIADNGLGNLTTGSLQEKSQVNCDVQSRSDIDQTSQEIGPMLPPSVALLHGIFHNYKKEIIPDKPVTVKMDLLLMKVKSTNEREGLLETVIALLIEWRDSRFIWTPELFENITNLAFESYRLWLPDLAMTNSADHLYALSRDTRFLVRVFSDGRLRFLPTGTARTWCALHLEHFPFDIQTCSIDFESWSLDSTMMVFNDSATLIISDSFTSSGQWSFCNPRAVAFTHDYYTGETFPCLRYEFELKRKSTFYIIGLIFPCVTLSFIQLLSFIIPSTKSPSDRIGFGTTNFLTLIVFQTIVTAEMPKSNDFSALSKYVISLIVISSFGIMYSVFAERMLHISSHPPPRYMLRILQHIAPFLPALWQQPVSGDDFSHPTQRKNGQPQPPPRRHGELSIGKVIVAGSSTLATAALAQDKKKKLTQRRESKAGYLKRMTAGGDSGRRSLSQYSQERRRHHQSSSSRRVASAERKTPAISYRCREDEENRRILAQEMERGLLGRSPTSVCGHTELGISDKKVPKIHVSIAEEDESSHRSSTSSTTTTTNDSGFSNVRRPRKTRAFSQMSASGWLFKEASNDELWAELVTRLDAMAIILSTVLSVGIPAVLFLPLYFRDGQCSSER